MPTTLAERFKIAAELSDTGLALMRQNLRRRHPEASPDEIDRRMREWLTRRPPDAPGRPRPLRVE